MSQCLLLRVLQVRGLLLELLLLALALLPLKALLEAVAYRLCSNASSLQHHQGCGLADGGTAPSEMG